MCGDVEQSRRLHEQTRDALGHLASLSMVRAHRQYAGRRCVKESESGTRLSGRGRKRDCLSVDAVRRSSRRHVRPLGVPCASMRAPLPPPSRQRSIGAFVLCNMAECVATFHGVTFSRDCAIWATVIFTAVPSERERLVLWARWMGTLWYSHRRTLGHGRSGDQQAAVRRRRGATAVNCSGTWPPP